jgi:AAA domain
VRELYFPMPYNDEQVSIISKLETSDGVVVQGPPGTGKTHTIANVICHFLAHGKRVLVTSKGDEALRVLQEKMPEQIRSLSVALLTDDRAGMKQFEHSVQQIATTVGAMQPAKIEKEITVHQGRLVDLHEKIAALDHAIAELASRQLSKIKARESEFLPEELARRVLEEEPLHNWLTDRLDYATQSTPGFTESDIGALRAARHTVASDLPYLTCELPAAESLFTPDAIASLHKDLRRSRSIDQAVSSGEVWSLLDTTPGTFDKAKALFELLSSGERLQRQLMAACAQILEAESARKARLSTPVIAPQDCELNPDVREAVERCCTGRSPFGLPFGKKEARAILPQLTVQGLKPDGEEAWTRVKAELDHRLLARSHVSSWNALAQEYGIDATSSIDAAGFRNLVKVVEHIQVLHSLATQIDRRLKADTAAVFGSAVAEKLPRDPAQARTQVASHLATQLDKGRLVYAMRQVADLRAKLEGKTGQVIAQLNALISDELGSAAVPEDHLVTHWQQLLAELRRLARLRSEFLVIDTVTAKIEGSGATTWARRLKAEPALGETDVLLPATWLEAWHWCVARTLLEGLEGHQELKGRFERRKTAEADLARTYRALIAAKTWLAVFRNSPEAVQQALQEYLNEIQAIGARTGIRAVHHRKLARAAMERAYPAVPCWIMPQWRVS